MLPGRVRRGEGSDVTLELTVLGSAGTYPSAGRLCSGHLVRAGDTAVLLDAGNGSTANLQRIVPWGDVDAVIVSHGHVDHCVDLVGAYYALRFDPSFGRRMPLYAPSGVSALLSELTESASPMTFGDVFEPHDVTGGDEVTVGSLQVRFADSVHPPPSVSMRLEAGGRSLVYSGDSAGGEELVDLARGADLFLCEATWSGDAADYPEGLHLTGRGAGEVAEAAGVGRLVLTHLAGSVDRERVRREAASAFTGPVDLADDLRSWVLS